MFSREHVNLFSWDYLNSVIYFYKIDDSKIILNFFTTIF